MTLIRTVSSLIFICLLVGEVYGQDTLPQSFVDQSEDGLVYNSAFQYKDYQASGLLVIKKENQNYHVMLLSKLGPTLMDFVIADDHVIWNKTIEVINRLALIKAMERDFRTMLLTPLNHPQKVHALGNNHYKVKKKIKIKIALSDQGRVISAENRGFINLFKSFVTYYYTDADNQPDEICMRHRNIKLKIELNQLQR